MKKLLLTLLFASLTSGITAVSAATVAERYPLAAPTAEATAVNGPLKAKATSLTFTLAGAPQNAYRLSDVSVGSEVAEAICMNPDNATAYAGNYISEVTVYSGGNSGTNTNTIRNATIFLSYDLAGEPFYTQDVTLSATVYSKNVVKLDTPCLIEAGKPVYIGYTFTVNSATDFYIVCDSDPGSSSPEASLFGVKSDSGWAWRECSADFGSMCISATITGDNLPANLAKVSSATIPMLVKPGEKFDIPLYITNIGTDQLEEIKATWQIGPGEPHEVVIEPLNPKTGNPGPFVQSGNTGYFKINDVSSDIEGNLILTITFNEINGQAVNYSAGGYSSAIVCLADEHAFTRNVVFEEWTGTWCGWCPRGLVMMEEMAAKYSDGSFIPIGVHSGDEMETASYAPFLQQWADGFPGAVANRMTAYMFDPSPTNGPQIYNAVRAIPSIAKIDVKAETDDELTTINVTSTTTFGVAQDNGLFRIAYVLTENKVGPYAQTNYYNGGGNGKMGGWENLARYVAYTFNDVARNIYSVDGIAGSIPDHVEALQPSVHNYQIPSEANYDLSNCNVVAMLINSSTGAIENAAITPVVISENSGVTSVTAEGTAVVTATKGGAVITGEYTAARFYNLAGQIVAIASGETSVSLPAGFYIVTVDGGAATKIAVR